MAKKVFNPDDLTDQQLQYAVDAKRIAQEIGVPPNLMLAAIFQESGFNPSAKSPTGPVGMGQLSKAAAKDTNVKDRYDPIQNMYGTAKYLKARLADNNGDARAALADYHDGPKAMQLGRATPAAITHADTVLGHVEEINKHFPETAQPITASDESGIIRTREPYKEINIPEVADNLSPEWGGMEYAATGAGALVGAGLAPSVHKQQILNQNAQDIAKAKNQPIIARNKAKDQAYVDALKLRNDTIAAAQKAQEVQGVDKYTGSQVKGPSSIILQNDPRIITNEQVQGQIPTVARGHEKALRMEPTWAANIDPITGLSLPSREMFTPPSPTLEKLHPMPAAPRHEPLVQPDIHPIKGRKALGAVGGGLTTAGAINTYGGDNLDTGLGAITTGSGMVATGAHNPRTAAGAAAVGAGAAGLQYLYDKAKEAGLIKGFSGARGSFVKKLAGAAEGPLSRISEYAHSVFDPRFDPRVKEQAKLANLRAQVEQTGRQDVPKVSLADYEGYPFITSMSDRTAAGGNLLGVNDVTFKRPVALKGGQDFMFNNPGMVWASAKAPVGQIMRSASAMRDFTGKDPLYIPWRMAPSGGDFAHMTGQTMLSQAESAMNKTQKRALDKQLSGIIPNWQGIDSPDSFNIFAAAPDKARKAAKLMMDRDFRDMGGLGIGEARLAVADPKQVAAPEGGLMNVGQIFTGKPMITKSGHESYPYGVPGEGLGRLDRDIQVYQMLPHAAEARGMADVLAPGASDLRALQMKPYGGIIDDKMLKALGY